MRKLMLVAALALAGCTVLTDQQKQQYQNLRALGAQDVVVKSPATAAWLNLLPGGGDVYNGQYGLAFGNLMYWPLSILWGVPNAAGMAEELNHKATIDHYLHGAGKGQFDREAILAPAAPRPAPEPARDDVGP